MQTRSKTFVVDRRALIREERKHDEKEKKEVASRKKGTRFRFMNYIGPCHADRFCTCDRDSDFCLDNHQLTRAEQLAAMSKEEKDKYWHFQNAKCVGSIQFALGRWDRSRGRIDFEKDEWDPKTKTFLKNGLVTPQQAVEAVELFFSKDADEGYFKMLMELNDLWNPSDWAKGEYLKYNRSCFLTDAVRLQDYSINEWDCMEMAIGS